MCRWFHFWLYCKRGGEERQGKGEKGEMRERKTGEPLIFISAYAHGPLPDCYRKSPLNNFVSCHSGSQEKL